MKKKILIIGLLFAFFACEDLENFSNPKDNNAPKSVTEVKSEAISDGVLITYNSPDDADLLGVKAIFSRNSNEEQELFASAARDTIQITGFGNNEEQNITLVAVDESMNESSPVTIKIKPGIPSIQTIQESLTMNPTFGGVFVSWDNLNNADVGLEFWRKNKETDTFEYIETHYTNEALGEFSFRGQESNLNEFKIIIRDRWDNYSEPVISEIKPLYEIWIKGADIFERWGYEDQSCIYRGDIPTVNSSSKSAARLWDEVTLTNNYYFHTGDAGNLITLYDKEYEDEPILVVPIYLTFDLKGLKGLSRMKMWMRGRNPGRSLLQGGHRYYQQGALKNYEIWACENPKTITEIGDKAENLKYWTEWEALGGTDAWKKDWVKLGETSALPPSGAKSAAQLIESDIVFADEGFETVFYPETTFQKFRYVRLVIKETWGGKGKKLFISELRFWGQEE